ncbi:restriction endonuclease subunit S [Gracilibacillus caseinilyticus]|uniref:Restriction endonuclease subunit S n=1 Tax=Gracilibacillus caseinilyticus TaxID=2932256 RepID=A0ABY4F0K1_9BACI|nr:restriction endonuclease subunit S [Gracilibacillus caseinilyticus]UOQ49622.1 restriction endonuclease subunit S [Gracilibacillus caseinilyticus]
MKQIHQRNKNIDKGIGILPEKWRVVELSEFIRLLNAGVSVNSEDRPANHNQYGVLKTSAVSNGVFYPSENKIIKEDEITRAKLNPIKGAIIISRMNTPELVGEIGYVDKTYKNLFLPDRLWQTEYNEKISGKWLASLLTLWEFKKQLKNIATGTSGSMKNISKKAFLSLKVPYPPYEEQQKIAKILLTWDKSVELKEKLIEQKKEQKKGLMQKLLTGKTRFPDYTENWSKVRLGELIKEANEKSTVNNQHQVLSVTKNGIMSQNKHFKKQVASENNVGYKVIRKNNLVFSAMNLWMGSLDVLTTFEVGIVSPAYKVFEFHTDKINPEFAKYFMKTEYMIWLYKMNSEQGASIVRRNLDLKGLLNTYVKIPAIKEQKEIANILLSSDKEINFLEKEIEELNKQKKGLMQLLLTGQIRVKV